MGANMGKQPTYTYGFPPRRRASNIDSANTFNKDFWASNGAPGASSESPGKVASAEFWMVDSERRYRQEVFDRESENFYPSASTYQTQNNFESTFSFNNSPMDRTSKPKPLTQSSSERSSSRMALPSPSPPYTSRNSQQSMIRAGEPKYLPRCVVGI